MTRASVAAGPPPLKRNSCTTASRLASSSSASGRPASRARWSSAAVTCLVSRPSVFSMSAWMAASSAPGTLYSSLAGIIMPATVRRSLHWARVRAISVITSSIEQIGQAALHLIGDVERDGLDGGGRIDAARGDEHAAVDDEEILDIMRAAPFV